MCLQATIRSCWHRSPHESKSLVHHRRAPFAAICSLSASFHSPLFCNAEVEAVITSVDGVHDVAAVLQDADKPTAAIVAYVTPAAVVSSDAVMAACQARLPHYMVPSAVVGLQVMPRLGNGKVSWIVGVSHLRSADTVQHVKPKECRMEDSALLKLVLKCFSWSSLVFADRSSRHASA